MPDAASPAEPLDHMALNLPRDEFLARMLLGVWGTSEIGLANPLTSFEIGAMARFCRHGRSFRTRGHGIRQRVSHLEPSATIVSSDRRKRGWTMPAAHGRNVALTPHLAKFVDDLVESGTYNSASEVVRDGLRELQRRKHADQLTEIQARVGTGLDELDRGEGSSGPPAEVLGGVLMEVKRRLGHK